MAIQTNGRIVVAGQGFLGFGGIARYNPDGSLDQTFGRAGIVIDHRAGPFEALALQPGGRIVTAAHQIGLKRDGHPMLYRYQGDGSPDGSFGHHGSVFEPYMHPGKDPRTLISRADGGLFVAVNHEGIDKIGEPSHGVVDAFSADGSFEAEIGRLTADADYRDGSWIGGIALQADGSLIGAGVKGDPAGSGILARFSPTSGGYPFDPTFGAGAGLVSLPPNFKPASVLVDADKIVVVGVSQKSLALTRYTADGRLDLSFGTSGVAALAPPPDGTTQLGEAAAVQPDGKIVVVGTSQNKEPDEGFYDPHVLVARFTPDGTLDSSFGSTGIASLANAGDPAVGGEDVELQGDGKIVISGTPPLALPAKRLPSGASAQPADIVLARFSADGTLDPTFGSGGIVATETCPGDRVRRQRAGCLPKPTVRLAVRAVSTSRPTLRLTARSNASWANIYKVKLILPPGLRIPRRYSKNAKIPMRSSGIEHIIGRPRRHSILFAVRSPRARIALLPGALQPVGKIAPRQRLRFRVKVDLFFSEASTSFTLLRPAGRTDRRR
jgi:uncharacterized delta-60 repeat protein